MIDLKALIDSVKPRMVTIAVGGTEIYLVVPMSNKDCLIGLSVKEATSMIEGLQKAIEIVSQTPGVN